MLKSRIKYHVGDATVPISKNGLRIIAHICNNKNGWGSGFVICLSKKWPEPEAKYRQWCSHNKQAVTDDSWQQKMLGEIQMVPVKDEHGRLYVANMIAQDGFASREKPMAVSYAALIQCLEKLGEWINTYNLLKLDIDKPNYNGVNASIHLPRIGAGLGGGSWPVIEQIIIATVGGWCDIHVYDLA